ncbi:SMI1/KNR4 family protein [Fusibacter ferrireducens]|uniref:SMI1/KNR4 family protein n=1 Tax=Fusibacter ferrireducens TaxID=2785058 RepID=A0ABS0A029_9FIRM|nr:SMI1/KNR4 family protein [Fusibacter ferrireducens]MBF4696057.1 SMI1/KNR4 family protein [Fusibacter ferrireducens]
MFNDIIQMLKHKGIEFQNGLSTKEIQNIECLYNIKFPTDLKLFLSTNLPVSKGFINWRDMSSENVQSIKSRLNWPLEGMNFDIKNNYFWYEGWGEKPESVDEAIAICEKNYRFVPQMIPIYSHRYIPSDPFEVGNPIFSIYQTDIIYYGNNLASYFEVEFNNKDQQFIDFNRIKKIKFWSEIME